MNYPFAPRPLPRPAQDGLPCGAGFVETAHGRGVRGAADELRTFLGFLGDRDHGVAEGVELLLRFALGRLEVDTLDIAKRLMDYGFHPPTIYFPLIVSGALSEDTVPFSMPFDLLRESAAFWWYYVRHLT